MTTGKVRSHSMADQVIGHYRLLKKLNEGGMGKVYLAQDLKLNRKAVLKFLLSQYALDSEFKARFEREARIAAVLQHPNIVTVYEGGEHQGDFYIAMEYVEGGSLRKLLRTTELFDDDVVKIAMEICDGLAAAHRAGITHRDLKPDNILLDQEASVKIADFGIAKLQDGPRLTKPGAVIGTLDYMSPEQAMGEELDHRSDIFSLGIILYEMLTGQRPFTGDNARAKIYAIITLPPPPLTQYRPDILPAWQQIIDKALAKNPAGRYQQVEALRADLEHLRDRLPQTETPAAEEIRTVEFIGKYRIENRLGGGGMGDVFKAWDTKLERWMALKKIKPDLAKDTIFRERFRDEAKALAKLDSNHIVRVYDLLETKEGLFIVMEYVEGASLDKIIQKLKALAPAKAAEMLRQMLRGIGHAHRAGILHRDLKPSNVMVTPQGIVKVMDFGLAKNQQGPKRTSAFGGGGTLLYMSPEQVQGLGNVDARSDLYSLGMTFYEMLAGRLPFEEKDSDYDIRKAIMEKDFPPPHQYNPAVPPALSEIVQKAIQKQPRQRFQSANEMLEAVVARIGKPAAPPKPEPRERKNESPARWIALFVLFAMFFVLLWLNADFLKEFFSKSNPPVKPVPATLSIVSQPNGATVFLNGDSLGRTPIKNFALEAGKPVRLRLRKTDYAGIDTSLIPGAGQALPLTFSLRPLPKKVTPPLPGSLKITSVPSGATVFLNGKLAGVTPYSDQQARATEYRLVVQQDGYVKDERTIAVRSGQSTAINVILKTEMGRLDITSQPSGAVVLLDGKRAGVTPLDLQKTPGSYSIVLRKAGYRDYPTAVTVTRGRVTPVEAQLILLEGTLVILVTPVGSIYIDGKAYKLDTDVRSSFKLSAGKHQVQVRNTSYGVWEKTVTIEPNKEAEFVIDFNKKFTVPVITVQPEWGELYVDDQRMGDTPRELRLRLGRHIIEVRREGYISERKTLNLENDLAEPLRFNLKPSP